MTDRADVKTTRRGFLGVLGAFSAFAAWVSSCARHRQSSQTASALTWSTRLQGPFQRGQPMRVDSSQCPFAEIHAFELAPHRRSPSRVTLLFTCVGPMDPLGKISVELGLYSATGAELVRLSDTVPDQRVAAAKLNADPPQPVALHISERNFVWFDIPDSVASQLAEVEITLARG